MPTETAAFWAVRAVSAVRYRFFLVAGLLPYLIGAAWARSSLGVFAADRFAVGLLGVFFAVAGVEAFNEHYDAKLGTDRVFNPSDAETIPAFVLPLGWVALACAAACGVWLARQVGWEVWGYALFGGFAAVFYVGPPLRLAYRGLGELTIGLAYGPGLMLGSVHLQAAHFVPQALPASLVLGLLLVALAVANAIPDQLQDRLVGKRNLAVRLGPKRAVVLYASLAFVAVALLALTAAVGAGALPLASTVAAAAGAVLVALSLREGRAHWDSPRQFVPAIRRIVLAYLVAAGGLLASLLVGRGAA